MASDSLSVQLSKILLNYEQEVRENIKDVQDEVAESTVELLKATSPKDRPEYYKGWGIKATPKGRVIANLTHPQLTHLLEKGHVKRGGKGRVVAQKHIKPAEQKAIEEFERRVIERLGK